MAASLVATWQVDPANMNEFLALGPEAKKLILGLGASNYRGFRSRISGPNTGSIINVIEFENNEAMGRFLDNAPSDAAYQALLAKAAALADGAATSVLDEIDIA